MVDERGEGCCGCEVSYQGCVREEAAAEGRWEAEELHGAAVDIWVIDRRKLMLPPVGSIELGPGRDRPLGRSASLRNMPLVSYLQLHRYLLVSVNSFTALNLLSFYCCPTHGYIGILLRH